MALIIAFKSLYDSGPQPLWLHGPAVAVAVVMAGGDGFVCAT